MKILKEDDLNKSRDEIVLSSYKVCQNEPNNFSSIFRWQKTRQYHD